MSNDEVSGETISTIDIYGPDWPARPTNIRPLSFQERNELYGSFTYVPNTRVGGGGIRITSRDKFSIMSVDVPQLASTKIQGSNVNGRVWVNANAVDAMLGLFAEWEHNNLTQYVLSFDGCYVPRYVRGSTTVLSNHSWGTAFDINASWNPLGKRPALVGEDGCVRYLVEIAAKHGWWWGGWGWPGSAATRLDGMHFERGMLID